MKYDQYIDLIRAIEISSKANKKAYEYKVFGLTMLGYAYIVGLIALLCVPVVLVGFGLLFAPAEIWRLALLFAKLWFIAIPGIAIYFGFLGGAIKALFAKVNDPEGIIITKSEAPELFAFVAKVCADLGASLPHKVLVDDTFNAAVATVPRFGLFGKRVFLILGVPLMKALSPEQFEAVVAHEIGHISGKHGNFAKWAYQVRESWRRLLEHQEMAEHKLDSLYEKFVNWYFPYLDAYSFILMREHEVEADRSAVRIVGAKPLAESLLLLEVKGRDLNDIYWASVHKENLVSAEPPKKTFTNMLGTMSFVNANEASNVLTTALARPSDYLDPHPSLGERLKLIGYWQGSDSVAIPTASDRSAADVYLGSKLDEIAIEFDRTWDEHVATQWQPRFEHFQNTQKRLAELDEKALTDALTPEEFAEKVGLTCEKDGPEAGIPIARIAAETHPDNADLIFGLGALLLQLGDESGIAHLDQAVELDKDYKYGAHERIFQYLNSNGRFDDARPYANFVEEESEIFQKAQLERSAIHGTDKFAVHDLDEAVVASIVAKVETFKEVTNAYLVNKVVAYKPEVPLRVIFIEPRPSRIGLNESDYSADRLIEKLVDALKDTEIHYFAATNGDFAALLPHLNSINGAKVFSR